MSIIRLGADLSIIDKFGKMTQQFRTFVNSVARLGIIEGSGSPEGVIEARTSQQYMDTAGTAGSILYIKKSNDISGDKKQGWILV